MSPSIERALCRRARESRVSAMPPLIVHVVYRLAVGGLENGVVNLINRLPVQSWRHAIVSLTDVDPRFAARISRDNVRFYRLAQGAGSLGSRLYPGIVALLRGSPAPRSSTREISPRWKPPLPMDRLAFRRACTVSTAAMWATSTVSNVRYQRVRRLFRPFVTRYIALSPRPRMLSARSRGGSGGQRSDQIYNGVDTGRFVPAAGGRAPIDGCPFQGGEGYWLVGTVGRLEAVKDQTNLARAFVAALRADPSGRARLRLVLVGDGKLRRDIEAILESAGVRELAWFAGEHADVVPLLQGIDCFVLPSLAEGVSNTVLEGHGVRTAGDRHARRCQHRACRGECHRAHGPCRRQRCAGA